MYTEDNLMKMLLIENALDSFQWSLRHLKDFLKLDAQFTNPDKSSTYLKQSILTLNSSLELFFKERISECNPLMIFKIDKEIIPDAIIKYYRLKNENKIDMPLYDYIVINEFVIHTIEYSKCIELYCSLYNIPDGNKNDFINLNSLRNDIMHLGINSQQEYYLLAGRLSNILYFIDCKILRSINGYDKVVKKARTDILSIQFTLSQLNENIWRNLKKLKIESICKKLNEVFLDNSIVKYAETKGISIDCGLTLDMEYSYLTISMKDNSYDIDIAALYSSPENNALILSDSEHKDGNVFGVFEINDKEEIPTKFYISKNDNGAQVLDFCEQGCFWKSKKYGKLFDYLSFSNETLIKMFKKVINYICDIKE